MVRQKDIADKLKISRATVVRALDPNGKIKSETRELVLKTAMEMGYKKNVLSSSLASKKQKVVYVFLVKSLNEWYLSELRRGFEKIKEDFFDYNYSIEIIETDIKKPELQLKMLKDVLSLSPNGIIITPLLKERIKPLIMKNSNTVFMTIDIGIDNSIFHIGPDYNKSGAMIGSLLSRFLRNDEEILILDTVDDKISSKLYLNGILNYLNDNNVKYRGPVFSHNLMADLEDIAREYMTEKIKGIYSSRFLNKIIPALDNFGYKNLTATDNGLSSLTRELISDNKLLATVVEDNYNAGYLAGKFMFESLYNSKLYIDNYITKPSIIIKENMVDFI